MKTLIRYIGLGCLAASLLIAPVRAEEPIPVGATVPITGPFSLSGRQYYNSLQMAEEDINKAGGINGRPVKFFFEDTQSANGPAVNAFVKLKQEHNPAFFFLTSYTPLTLAAMPEIRKAGVPAISGAEADVVTTSSDGLIFRVRPNLGLTMSAMAKFLKEKLKVERPGIMFVQNDTGQLSADLIVKNLAGVGITPAAVEAYGANDKDFSAQLLRLRSAGADAIVLFPFPSDAALILRQSKALGLKMPVVSTSGLFLPATLALVSPADMVDVWGLTGALLDPNDGPELASFMQRYKTRFNIDADDFASAYYDGALMMADGMRAVGTSPDALKRWFASLSGWKGLTRVYTFEANNGARDVAIVKVVEGTKRIERIDRVNMR